MGMIVFVIAGGSGTRLWPLSTHSYPKHLLKLTNEKSLLQNTIERAERVTSTEQIFVISDSSHVKHVQEQLKHIPKSHILAEPARRGTSSCIAWALSEVQKRGISEDEPVLFLWADHLIRSADGFSATALKAGELAATYKKIVFIGVEPTYPSTGLGYIHKGKALGGWQDVYEFSGFVEKPNLTTAQSYFSSGNYLWNTGYLVGTLCTFKKHFEHDAPDMKNRFETLLKATDTTKAYLGFESIAIDYVFSELIKDALTLPGAFDWMDIGSFNDLHEVSMQDEDGNHIKGSAVALEHATNSYVRNETALPVAVIGLDNVIVVVSDNGVLVSNKNYSQKVGDVAKRLQE